MTIESELAGHQGSVFERRLSTMRNALERWRHYTGEEKGLCETGLAHNHQAAS
jgi:hypothetical protein